MGKGAALLLAGLSLLAAVRAQDSVCHPTADEVRAGFLPTAGACVPPAPDPEEEPKMRGAALHWGPSAFPALRLNACARVPLQLDAIVKIALRQQAALERQEQWVAAYEVRSS